MFKPTAGALPRQHEESKEDPTIETSGDRTPLRFVQEYQEKLKHVESANTMQESYQEFSAQYTPAGSAADQQHVTPPHSEVKTSTPQASNRSGHSVTWGINSMHVVDRHMTDHGSTEDISPLSDIRGQSLFAESSNASPPGINQSGGDPFLGHNPGVPFDATASTIC